jgi:hypothetical protein
VSKRRDLAFGDAEPAIDVRDDERVSATSAGTAEEDTDERPVEARPRS